MSEDPARYEPFDWNRVSNTPENFALAVSYINKLEALSIGSMAELEQHLPNGGGAFTISRALAEHALQSVDQANRVLAGSKRQGLRVEALRAAATVVSAQGGSMLMFGEPPDLKEAPVNDATIQIAEEFLTWLEGGK